ncbi:hypothetical protein DPMN_072879 [Dreissena polymorpha]|uniref:Uncharacterized protein n=1 Tax=Dreissena polymorpha TaxID=45954 RepID=A0A9D4HCD6_DREPO|nr:hypothetical protein DPMN_072879 [Dreissena polymorpha]
MGSSASVTHVQEYNSLKNEFVKQEVETQEVEFKAITLEEPEVAAINLTNLKKVFKGRIPVRAAGDKNTCFITGERNMNYTTHGPTVRCRILSFSTYLSLSLTTCSHLHH